MDAQLTQMERKERLEWTLIILLIISGSLFDLTSFNLSVKTCEYPHSLFRELRLLGFAMFSFKALPYQMLKLKILSFMFIIWSSVIIIYNAINPQNIPIYVTLLPHSLYLWWLIRVLTIQKDKPSTERDLERVDVYSAHGAGVPYNILMPVNSQRGMFQALFTLRNPLYETRLLVSRNTIVGIAKNKFTGFAYSQTHAKSLIKKGGKIVVCKDFSQKKLDNLLGKAYIPVLRDCRKLEM